MSLFLIVPPLLSLLADLLGWGVGLIAALVLHRRGQPRAALLLAAAAGAGALIALIGGSFSLLWPLASWGIVPYETLEAARTFQQLIGVFFRLIHLFLPLAIAAAAVQSSRSSADGA